MNLLRDRWRRSAFHQFWLGLDTGDRATALIGIVLAFAAALTIQALVRAYSAEPDDRTLAPEVTAPPFELGFAELAR